MSIFYTRIYQSIKIFILIVFGSVCVHIVTLSIDYFSFTGPTADGLSSAIHNQLTVHVLPIMLAYGSLFTVIYFLWQKYHREIELQHAKDIQLRNEQAVLETTQQLTAIMAQYITRHNNEIKEWIETRRINGQVPPRLENANRKISEALEAMTEISYVLPYTDKNTNTDYVKYLENFLSETLN
ncbi:MAG: hypothetical protein CVV49_01300 [Spirochaetae bacterium HGW-Spirochaetae-5]|nr:MAG: hypothetical protein CVV49_01300 [Spirochaetae bacterium HGW-Spirochaetae-5]